MQKRVSENRRDNQEWTIQRRRQHRKNHRTKIKTTQKSKKMSKTDPTKTPWVIQIMADARKREKVHFIIKHPLCVFYKFIYL